jgi:hypothetical protein
MSEHTQCATDEREKTPTVVSMHNHKQFCRCCGVDFTTSRQWQKFCSPTCQKKYWKQQQGLSALYDRIDALEKESTILTRQVNELYKHLGIMDYK